MYIIIVMLFPCISFLILIFFWFLQNEKETCKEVKQLEDFGDSDRFSYISFYFSLHLLGCTVCLRNRLLSALYQASNRQNHCKVRNKRRLKSRCCYEILLFHKWKKGRMKTMLFVWVNVIFPWWSLILNISFNTFHRKLLYIVDYLGLNLQMAPRITDVWYWGLFLLFFPSPPAQNKRSSLPSVF